MKIVKVAVGIIIKNNQVLLTQRLKNKFMANQWEFAGGKIEKGENEKEALEREFLEELGIIITKAQFIKNMIYDYPSKRVDLAVFKILEYDRVLTPQEGQKMAWVDFDKINTYNILPTVNPLLKLAKLTPIYWITPQIIDKQQWIKDFQTKIQTGVKLICLRAKIDLDAKFVQNIYQLCKQNQVLLLLNIPNRDKLEEFCDGFHFPSKYLHNNIKLSKGINCASTHNLKELKIAEGLGMDFATLSPIKKTQTHPEVSPLGFDAAKKIIKEVDILVYALGGMQKIDLISAHKIGAYGISGIRLLSYI